MQISHYRNLYKYTYSAVLAINSDLIHAAANTSPTSDDTRKVGMNSAAVKVILAFAKKGGKNQRENRHDKKLLVETSDCVLS